MTTRNHLSIMVIGTVSLDILHLANGRIAHVAGGAGLYTALAARHAGGSVVLFAPRPHPMPALLQPIARLLPWIGPAISPAVLPRLEIAHHGGGRATLLNASWGAEAQLTPDTLPAEVKQSHFVHIAALSTAQRQLDFLDELHRRPPDDGKQRLISGGTYARLVCNEARCVNKLLAQADIFFMNENEARGLFGEVEQAHTRPGALLFVTRGAAGALLVEAEQVTSISGEPAEEVDPTGAGDTFCGATLAALSRGYAPLVAAQKAVVLAAQTVRTIGPSALLP